MTIEQTEHVFCTVIAQSAQVEHNLVANTHGRPYAVTPRTFHGDWSTLRRGDAVEVEVTIEPLPQTKSARLLSKGPQKHLVGKVLGRGEGTPYVLVEGPGKNQYVVLKKYFVGDWDALTAGNDVELVITGEQAGRVLFAKLVDG